MFIRFIALFCPLNQASFLNKEVKALVFFCFFFAARLVMFYYFLSSQDHRALLIAQSICSSRQRSQNKMTASRCKCSRSQPLTDPSINHLLCVYLVIPALCAAYLGSLSDLKYCRILCDTYCRLRTPKAFPYMHTYIRTVGC